MWLSKWDPIFIEDRGTARSAQNFRRGAGRLPTAVTGRMAALPALKSYFFLLPRVDFGRQAAMGQPPQLGHFTSKMSVSITVAAPNSGSKIGNDRKTRMVAQKFTPGLYLSLSHLRRAGRE